MLRVAKKGIFLIEPLEKHNSIRSWFKKSFKIDKKRKTTTKTRVIAQQQHQVRVDEEDAFPINEEDEFLELEYENNENNKIEISESQSYIEEVEEEIKEFVSSEDSEIKEQYKISEDMEENIVSDEIEENTKVLE